MNRTRIVFFSIVVLALAIVGASLVWRSLNQPQPLTVTPRGPIQVRILTALPVEPWVREAARQFNESKRELEGEPIQVEVIAMDGLAALGKWDRDEFGVIGERAIEDLTPQERERLARFPTVWIPDSRYLVELANAPTKNAWDVTSS